MKKIQKNIQGHLDAILQQIKRSTGLLLMCTESDRQQKKAIQLKLIRIRRPHSLGILVYKSFGVI